MNSDLDELDETDKIPEEVITLAEIECASAKLKKKFEDR
jgi:hypothetical protein